MIYTHTFGSATDLENARDFLHSEGYSAHADFGRAGAGDYRLSILVAEGAPDPLVEKADEFRRWQRALFDRYRSSDGRSEGR